MSESDTGHGRRPDPPEDEDGASDLFRTIGRQVRLLRERAGLTQRELGDRLGYGEDLISSLERGRRTPQPEFLAAADELLGAGGLLRAATEDVQRAKARARVRHPAWFRDYARLESQAVEISFFSTVTFPGLLQTEPYARATFTVRQPLLDETTIEDRVAARLDRQQILTPWPAPVVTVVVDESVLRREIGGPEVQRDQLKSLLQSSRLRSTTIQVLPLTCEGMRAWTVRSSCSRPRGSSSSATSRYRVLPTWSRTRRRYVCWPCATEPSEARRSLRTSPWP